MPGGALASSDDSSVMAIVLTFNSPRSLQRCLAGIRDQSVVLRHVVVVDNASEESVDPFVDAVPGSRVLRLDRNVGPAGGHAAGLREFLKSPCRWAWVLDDDCWAHPDSLGAQLAAARGAGGARRPLVLSNVKDAETALPAGGMGWCGVLLAREIVENVGVPNEALVWWTEDTEYLQWRIPRAGFAVITCDDAVVEVNRTRARGTKPPWKFYYESRNQVYHRLHVQRPTDQWPVPRYLTLRVRAWRAARSVAKLGGRALFVERSGRLGKSWMVLRGALDGVRGRLGETVPLGAADRPLVN
jgi:GT2 family glycosyltransferase